MTKKDESNKTMSLLDQIAEKTPTTVSKVKPESTLDDMFNIDGFLSEIDTAPTRKLLDIPEQVKKRFEEKGVVLGWIRAKGQGGADNLLTRRNQGWRPLPAEAVPEMCLSAMGTQKLEFLNTGNTGEGLTNDYIVRKDLVLCANLESNWKKVKDKALGDTIKVEQSLKRQAQSKGLDVDALTVRTKVGENADFG